MIRQRFECLEKNYARAFGECLESVARQIKQGEITPPASIAVSPISKDAGSMRAYLVLEGSERVAPSRAVTT